MYNPQSLARVNELTSENRSLKADNRRLLALLVKETAARKEAEAELERLYDTGSVR